MTAVLEVVSTDNTPFANVIDIALGAAGFPLPATYTPAHTGHVEVTAQATVAGTINDALLLTPIRDGSPIAGAVAPQSAITAALFSEVEGLVFVSVTFTDQVTPNTAHSWGLRVTDAASGAPNIQSPSGSANVVVREVA